MLLINKKSKTKKITKKNFQKKAQFFSIYALKFKQLFKSHENTYILS